jgi:hypothetical protein
MILPLFAISQVHKCVSPSGTVTYQQTPCVRTQAEQPLQNVDKADHAERRTDQESLHQSFTKQSVVAVTQEQEKQPQKDLDGYRQIIAQVLIQKKFCDSAYPGFKEKYASIWGAYTARHGNDISETMNGDGFKYWQAFFDNRPLPKSELELRAVGIQCDGEVLDTMLPLILPSDPKLSAPENTWANFLAAWKKGDRNEMRNYLVGEERTKLRREMPMNSPSELRELAQNVASLEFVKGNGEQREYAIKGKDISNWPVTFIRLDGNWFISRW